MQLCSMFGFVFSTSKTDYSGKDGRNLACSSTTKERRRQRNVCWKNGKSKLKRTSVLKKPRGLITVLLLHTAPVFVLFWSFVFSWIQLCYHCIRLHQLLTCTPWPKNVAKCFQFGGKLICRQTNLYLEIDNLIVCLFLLCVLLPI